MKHEMCVSNDTSANKSQVNNAIYCEEIHIYETPSKY